MSWLTQLVDGFSTAAFNDPLSFLLIVTGAVLVGAASAVFGALTLGAAVEFIKPDFSRGRPR